MFSSKLRKIFRLGFIAVFVLIFLFVVYQHTNPFGRPRVYDYSLSRKINRFISPLRPKERLSRHYKDQASDWVKDLKGPLIYFDLGPVSADQKLTLTIKYKAEVSEIRFGEVLSAGKDLDYRAHPFYNAFLQDLDWEYVEKEGVFLYQKEKIFPSVDEYLTNVPEDKVNAVYFFSDRRIKNAETLTHFENPLEEIDYIVTIYKKALLGEDGWLENTYQFDMANAFMREDMLAYLFSIPELEGLIIASNTVIPKVTISHIQVIVEEPPSKYWVRAKKLFGVDQ